MLPLVAAALGGAAVAASSRIYNKWQGFRGVAGKSASAAGGASEPVAGPEPQVDPAGSAGPGASGSAYEFARMQSAVHRSRTKLTIALSRSASTLEHQFYFIKEEVEIVASAMVEEAQFGLKSINESEIKPLRAVATLEWQAFTAAVADDESMIADSARAVRDLFGMAVAGTADFRKRPVVVDGKARPKRRVSKSPKAVWRSLKQAKELVFDDSRTKQMDDVSGAAAGSARQQIAKAEQVVNRYLKVAATSVVAATVGVTVFAPLKLVSGALILYAAIPVFKGAYTDLVVKRKITIKLLDSASFIGLLAGGYFLICSITSTIFHASTKMMLKTEDRSRQMLANMFGQQPRTVHVLVDGVEIEKPFEALMVGDVLVVHAGQMIPVDGAISNGTAAVDQHVLTGEAQPAEKGVGDRVFAATMMLAGRIEVQVEKTGAETAAAQIRDLLANTTDFRTAIQARWIGVANRTVLPTLGLSAIALPFLGPASALAVINSNYVAVLKVASPLGMLNFLQRASRAGILIKDGRALEAACKVDTVVFDKTGTLTEPEPHVGEIHVFGDTDANDLLTCAAAVEANQSHPIAMAILAAARERKLTLPALEDARYEVGYGIQARLGERLVHVGSARYMAMQHLALPEDFAERREEIHSRGGSVIFVAWDGRLAGALELRPTLRQEAKQVVASLKEMGLAIHIISGDNAAPTAALAAELGIEHFFAEVLPQDKSRLIEELQQTGRRVCFVGDGINDAIALKQADVSVSIRGASSLATDTAQMILMDESLRQLPQLFEVARDYEANLNTLMTTTFVPGFASLFGVFFLGAGNAAALLLFNLSMIAGFVNAIWPTLTTLDEPAAPGTAGVEATPARVPMKLLASAETPSVS